MNLKTYLLTYKAGINIDIEQKTMSDLFYMIRSHDSCWRSHDSYHASVSYLRSTLRSFCK